MSQRYGAYRSRRRESTDTPPIGCWIEEGKYRTGLCADVDVSAFGSELQAISDLYQCLLRIPHIEAVAEVGERAVISGVRLIATTVVHNVEIRQRCDFVAVTDLEAQVHYAQIVDRLIGRHGPPVAGNVVGLPQMASDAEGL